MFGSVEEIYVSYDCWENADEETCPEEQDCDGRWTVMFDCHSDFSIDFNNQKEGQTFYSDCPKCGRRTGVYVRSAREANDEARWEAMHG